MTVVVKFNHFGTIAADLIPKLHMAVADTATIIAGRASSFAPVDTGFLRSSIYVLGNDYSMYGGIGAPVKKGAYALPEEKKPSDPLTGIIAVAANYGIFQEFGTRKMAAQPYLVPAVMASAGDFQHELDGVFTP